MKNELDEMYKNMEKMERELYVKAKERDDKIDKFRALANIIDLNQNGNRARQLVNIVVREYEQKPQELTKFFSDKKTLTNSEGVVIDPKVDGIARSAYIMITQDFSVLHDSEFGGFGITINTSPKKLQTADYQFVYAKLSGDALQNSINKDYALQHTKNSGNSLKDSRNYDGTLWDSVNTDEALKNSKNYGNVLFKSENFDKSLSNSKNFDNALGDSMNFDNSLKASRNYKDALTKSVNGDDVLKDSRNYGSSLCMSYNGGNSLQNSINSGEALMMSKNFNNAGVHSKNGKDVGKFAETYDDAFTNAEMKEKSFLFGKHYGEFKGGKFSFNNLNKAYQLAKSIRQERLIYFARLN